MKFSTETLSQITALLIADFEEQLERKTIPMEELEQGLRETLHSIGQGSLGRMLSIKDQQSNGIRHECACGEQARRISRRAAKILSVFGWTEYQRSYYACAHCHRRWFALDEDERLRAGRVSDGMNRLLGIAGVTVSFEEAQRQVREYLLVDVSVNTLRAETQRIGAMQSQREREWLSKSQDLDYLQSRERQPAGLERVYGSIDGAFVPLAEGWKEEKTVCWYKAGRRYGSQELRALDLHYYTSLQEATAFGELVWATGLHHCVDQAKELIFVCDAAAWIWKIIERYFPDAVQIVDWYHACQRLYAVADMLVEGTQQERLSWIEQMKGLLWEGDVTAVLQILQALFREHPTAEIIQDAITYYKNNQKRMDYAHFRKQGYFIGSGSVESACKQIVSLRLKRAGARWTKSGASAVAKARAAWLSQQWDELPWVA
jgi:Uncharacterised protein family (UPF0236)